MAWAKTDSHAVQVPSDQQLPYYFMHFLFYSFATYRADIFSAPHNVSAGEN
jgi:hypothetical protein